MGIPRQSLTWGTNEINLLAAVSIIWHNMRASIVYLSSCSIPIHNSRYVYTSECERGTSGAAHLGAPKCGDERGQRTAEHKCHFDRDHLGEPPHRLHVVLCARFPAQPLDVYGQRQ